MSRIYMAASLAALWTATLLMSCNLLGCKERSPEDLARLLFTESWGMNIKPGYAAGRTYKLLSKTFQTSCDKACYQALLTELHIDGNNTGGVKNVATRDDGVTVVTVRHSFGSNESHTWYVTDILVRNGRIEGFVPHPEQTVAAPLAPIKN